MTSIQLPERESVTPLWSVGVLALICAILPVAPATGQSLKLSTSVPSPNPIKKGLFGATVEKIGDMNGDDVSDIIVGAPFESADGKQKAGRAYLISGSDGRVLVPLSSPNPSEYGGFGSAVSPVGDLNEDGAADFIVGAPEEPASGKHQAGKVYLFSGADGTLLRTYSSPNTEKNGAFGRSVAGVDDANGDGTPDLLVGAPLESIQETQQTGRAYLISGAEDLILRTFFSPKATHWGNFGQEVASAGDQNGDGTEDFLISAPSERIGDQKAGRVYLFSGTDGARLDTLTSPEPSLGGRFGAAIQTVSGPGKRPKTLIGAPGVAEVEGKKRKATGRTYVFGGTDRTIARTLTAPEPNADSSGGGGFGASLAAVRPSGEERSPTIAVGAPSDAKEGSPAGRVYLFGQEGAKSPRSIRAPNSVDDAWFGQSISFIRSSKEKRHYLMVGAPLTDWRDKEKSGKIYKYSPDRVRAPVANVRRSESKEQTDAQVDADTSVTTAPAKERVSSDTAASVDTVGIADTEANADAREDLVPSPAGEPAGLEVGRKVPRSSMKRPNAIAVVIGIKEYQNPDIPNVDYAVRDARTMRRYLHHAFGYREENIIFVKNASGTDLRRLFGTATNPRGKLYNWVKSGKSEVYVYYSGHGAPDPASEKSYLVASNTDPDYLTLNGYPLNQLYENLSKVPAQSVTVVLEACFSGTSAGGAVIQNASPAVLSVENPMLGMKKGLVFAAGAADQIASWYPEKRHGLFTYYFLKGLRGKADQDGNRAITAKEMEKYLKEKVPYWTRRMHNREQAPQVIGQNMDRVLVRYQESEPEPDR